MARFDLRAWSAWAPGLTTADAWQRWANDGVGTPNGAAEPGVEAMPPMLRRRAQRLGKMALEALYRSDATTTIAHDAPIVFCSRHGELQRCVHLLQELAATGAVSPQSFSMSVHNAIAGLYTIAGKRKSNVIAIAAGANTAIAGLTEAVALLADGVPAVRVVICDEALPDIYAQFADEPQFAFAGVIEVVAGERYTLADCARTIAGARGELPGGLALLRLLIAAMPIESGDAQH